MASSSSSPPSWPCPQTADRSSGDSSSAGVFEPLHSPQRSPEGSWPTSDVEPDASDGETVAAAPEVGVGKKKRKKKKRAKSKPQLTEEEKEAEMTRAAEALALEERKAARSRPKAPKAGSVLCISRNKHWRHISAYHGPWLQLPVELLESLLALSLDPVSLSSIPAARSLSGIPSKLLLGGLGKERDKGPSPPPIDPGVFRSVISIRRLVDEASDLAIRASSGLSAFNLSIIGSQAAQLDLPPSKNGREPSMSALRTHRLRALACQRLAEAYKWDEIAASVMVMQGASALDDVAEKVLRIDPTNPDALYVHFFHEKIPSRMVAENTTTETLDALINAHPYRLEFYRTRGVVKIFLDQYAAGARDFTHALVEARAARKGRQAHCREEARQGAKGRKGKGKGKASVAPGDLFDSGDLRNQHASVGPEAPLPMEPQCLFLRASSFLMHAVWLIESAALKLEGVGRTSPGDGMELRLCNLTHGKYGGIEIGNPDGPLGSRHGKKLNVYRDVFATPKWRNDIHVLARRSIRDHERFLSHFDQMESMAIHFDQNTVDELHADPLREPSLRSASGSTGEAGADGKQTFTTYHPLLVESHYSILLNHLLLGDFPAVLEAYIRIAHLVDGLEGYPVFLPARSMAQAEFVEVFDRLLSGWRFGATPGANHSGTKMILPSEDKAFAMEERYPAGISPAASSSSSSSSSSLLTIAPDGPARGASPASNGRSSPSSSSGGLMGVSLSNVASGSCAGPSSRPLQPTRFDPRQSLDAVRQLILRASIKAKERQQRQAEKVAEGKRLGKPASFGSMNIPLSGPRVEVLLVWLASVVLPELEGWAESE